jgi:hypothetical protein
VHEYGRLKKLHGKRVSQTIDSPIMIMDFWELSDAFAAVLVVLMFGVILYSWGIMSALLLVCLVAVPIIKRSHNRGVFLHWPYRNLWISLPGLLNPRGRRKFSD